MAKVVSALAVVIIVLGVAAFFVFGVKKKTVFASTVNNPVCVAYDLTFGWEDFGQAELYLAAESSYTPGTRVITPINVGKQGIQNGFVELPFELRADDTITFTLLDDDDLTSEEEQKILDAANTVGETIIECGNAILSIKSGITLPRQAKLTIQQLVDLGAKQIISDTHEHPWDNFGNETYIVPEDLPKSPALANPLSISSWGIKRMELKVYKN